MPTDGASTSDLGNSSAKVLQDLSNAAQAAIHGDGTGKSAALASALTDTETAVSKEAMALLERLVAYEATTGFGIEGLISIIASKIGGVLPKL